MKISLRTPKPRNPLVVPSHMRRAGRHEAGRGAARQRAQTALRQELERMKPPNH